MSDADGFLELAAAVFEQAVADLANDGDPVAQAEALDWLHSPSFDWWYCMLYPTLGDHTVEEVRAAMLHRAGWEDDPWS